MNVPRRGTGHPDLEQTLVTLPEIKSMVMGMVPEPGFQQKLQSDPAFFNKVARQVMMGTDPITLAKKNLRQQWLKANENDGCIYDLDYNDPDYVGTAKAKLLTYQKKLADYTMHGNPACKNTGACTPVASG